MAADDFVLDLSALIASFYDVPDLEGLIADADADRLRLYLPAVAVAVAVAEAEAVLRAGPNGWAHLLLTRNVHTMRLTEHAALEIGQWPGSLATRHAVHEARALEAIVVTGEPSLYAGFLVPIRNLTT